ncbi:hypothetical protein [Leptolyngbya sp. PCC 6406]|uniref:hypothetical protein n=1 Tax=Leptolyngbya sp. PCC 6406 TaxID=1173264 RepID=UPI0002ACB078|nr:hypothetical protein [Leptolyngbya sp. PCC 6406]
MTEEPKFSEPKFSDDSPAPPSERLDDAEEMPTPAISAAEAEDWDLDDSTWETPPSMPPPEPKAPGMAMEFMGQWRQLWSQGQRLWQHLLAGVRSRIPAAAALSDGVLGGVIVGSLVLLLTLINGLGGSPAPATESGSRPEITTRPPSDLRLQEQEIGLDQGQLQVEAEGSDGQRPAQMGHRIGEIQAQLKAVSALYGEGLVQSVQANLPRSRLTVNLSDGWYRLTATGQDNLAADLLKRAGDLQFGALEMRSPAADLLARSPVVGNQMVILQRQPLPEVPIPERPRYRIIVD